MIGAGGYGAIAGAVLGGVGGFISAHDAKRQQRLFAHRQRKAITEARQFADERVADIVESELFKGAQQFLERTYGDPLSSPLAQDYQTGVRQAQAARGLLFGGAAVSQEASGLAAFSAQLQQSLLPQALQFAQAPEQIRQSVLGFETPLRVAYSTGAAVPGITPPQILDSPLSAAFKQAAAGAAGGYQIGASMMQPQGSPPMPAGDRLDSTWMVRGTEGFNPMSTISGLNQAYAQPDLFGGEDIPLEAMRLFQPDSYSAIARLGGLQR